MEYKTIEQTKRESTNTILRCSTALKTINLNRADANIELFNMLVTQIANATNELVLISNDIKTKEN